MRETRFEEEDCKAYSILGDMSLKEYVLRVLAYSFYMLVTFVTFVLASIYYMKDHPNPGYREGWIRLAQILGIT